MGENMIPSLPPDQAAQQALFYTADSPQGVEIVNKVMGKTVRSILKSQNGVLLLFNEFTDYLILLGGQMPVFGQPRPVGGVGGVGSGGGQMEIIIEGTRPVVVVSFFKAIEANPDFWKLWDIPEVKQLWGRMVTGYSYEMKNCSDGQKREFAIIELHGDMMLAVCHMFVTVLKRNQPVKPI